MIVNISKEVQKRDASKKLDVLDEKIRSGLSESGVTKFFSKSSLPFLFFPCFCFVFFLGFAFCFFLDTFFFPCSLTSSLLFSTGDPVDGSKSNCIAKFWILSTAGKGSELKSTSKSWKTIAPGSPGVATLLLRSMGDWAAPLKQVGMESMAVVRSSHMKVNQAHARPSSL